MNIKWITFLLIISILIACNGNISDSDSTYNYSLPIIEYTQINSYPHDTNSFTEGFLFNNGELYESTGANSNFSQTRSLFGKVDLKTGKIETKVELDPTKYFGEGITFLNGKVFQLTYKNKIGFIYDTLTYKKIGEFTIPSNEGWGLTTDGINLIMSDGTNTLTYLNPDNLSVVKKISVTQNGFVEDRLNELEFINGYIYANLWTTNTIIKIDVKSGKVVGKIDLSALANDAEQIYPDAAEMNGIAYDSITGKILITGKLWPKIYEIKFSH